MADLSEDERTQLHSLQQDSDTGRPVRITWTDSGLAHHTGWEKFKDLSDDAKVMNVETVGIWMGENERVVMVAHSRDSDNNNWNVAMTVFKPCIIKKEWL